MLQAPISQSASQGSVQALNKSPQLQRKHADTKVQLRGKTLAEQDALLKPEEPKKDEPKSKKPGGAGARDKSGNTKPKVYPPDVQKVLERWPAGVAMSFYADYAEGSKAAAAGEFRKRATEQAGQIGCVSMSGGKLVLGKTHAIDDQATIIEKVNAVSAYLASVLSPEDLAADCHKLSQVHIYSHGWKSGMSTGAHRHKRQKGNLSTKGLEDFVGAISGALRSDVNVALFACSTGKDMDDKGKKDIDEVDDPGEKKKKGKKPREHGEGSFADEMREQLTAHGHKDANVGGHMTAGHMSGNPEGRYFTGDGPAATFFDTVFPAEFRAKEAAKLQMSEKKFAEKLHRWFIRYTVFWRKLKGKKAQKIAKGHDKVDMGYVMMVDPTQAKKIFRAAWDAAGGSFKNVSYAPEVDYSKLGVGGADSAREARAEGNGNIIDL